MPRQDDQDETVVTIDDIERLGEANLDDATRSYIASGAGRGQTLKENTNAFMRLRFRPRSLVDVSKIHTATTVLGRKISFPLGFSPSAAHMIAHEDGEFGTARAAQDAGTVMVVSAMSTASIEDIRASAPGCLLWQQMYIFRNRSLTESMIRRAEHQGIAAIVVTVDSPVYGQAIFINKNMFVLPRGLRFANLEASWPGRSFTFDPSKEGSIGHLLSSSVTWEDFRWLRSITTLPLVAKGILTAESALAAYENGASAVVVSNHGGRLLDGNRATIEVLPEVVAAVGDRMEIYLDGGVRSGADAVKAVSFGARAVFVGRPALWGLAYNGKHGVDKVLEIFRSEFNHTIQLLGVPDAKNLGTDFVVREPYYSQPLQPNGAPRHPWGDLFDYKIAVR
ncbi:L-lactate oxidase isoform X2 [Rhipicephalus sanguineus]|uniref:L-lactate oxidase isoform X2 n=1 Tax=Rhipicephalus sanguineus TaxID=34632 RepID=UPI0018939894|nr:L-lactate oxidase isoform X2 [Rhipicephalus sanguineus]